MSHRQGIPRRQPPQGRSSRGSGTPAGRVAPMGRRSSGRGDADVRTQPTPAPHVPRPSPSPSPGPHRVKGWELKAGHRPLQEELLRGGEGQAQIEGKLGVRVPVRQEGVAGPGVRAGGGLTRRSAQEKSFFFRPGAQLAGRPAASGTCGGHGLVSTSSLGTGCHTLPPAQALTSYEDAVPDRDGHPPIGLGKDRKHRP